MLANRCSIQSLHKIAVVLCVIGALMLSANRPAQAQSYELANGISHYENGDFEKAIFPLEQALAKNPMLVEAFYYLAASQLGLKQYREVIETTDKALSFAPNHVQILLVKAEALYHLDYLEAIPVYLKISDLVSKRTEPSAGVITKRQADSYLGYLYQRKANDEFLSGNSKNAIQNYKKARALNPDSLTVHNNLAYTLLQEKNWEEAISALEQGLQRFPSSEQLLFLKGQAHRGAGQKAEMLQTFKMLHELHPEKINYAIIYGQTLMSQNQARKANEFMEQLLQKYPDNEEVYEALIAMSEQRFDFTTKKNVLKRQRKAFPESQPVALELADTHILLKEYEQARAIFDSLNTANPSPLTALRWARTHVYEQVNDAAISAYNAVLESWPDNFEVKFEAAKVHQAAGLTAEALHLFKAAFEIRREPKTAMHLVELLTLNSSNNSADTERLISYLKETVYFPVGEYFELNYAFNPKDESRRYNQFRSSLIGLLSLYSDVQSSEMARSERMLEGDTSPKPELLQDRRFLEKLDSYVDGWFVLLKKHYPPEVQNELLDDVMTAYPNSSRLYYFKGRVAHENQDFEQAQSALEQSIRLGGKDPHIYLLLGEVQQGQGSMQAAELSYERALSLNQDYKPAYERLIALSAKQGRLNELCDRWLQRYQNNKDHAILKEYLIAALHKANRFEDAKKVISRE